MHAQRGYLNTSLLALVVGLQFGGSIVWGQREIGFIEKFALSSDRREVLQDLIPGTEEFFYYNCLHHQNEGELAEAQAVLGKWRAQLGETSLVQRMHSRQMLLTYSENPQRTLDYLRDALRLDLNHAPPSRNLATELPSEFDNTQISTAAMLERVIAQDRSLNQIETSGLGLVLQRELAVDQLRGVLQRVDRNDLPRLVERIAEELALKDSRGFGAFPIHQQLTLVQLEQLLKLRAELIEQDGFVRAYAARLAPSEGVSLADKAELRSYLQRLSIWVRKLPASQNNFKALVIGNFLKLDMSEGKYDRELFLEYLALPRNSHYYDLTRFKNSPPALIELGFAMVPQVQLPAVGDDSQMVLRYLENFLKDAGSVDEFAKFLNREYLERVLAETKVLYAVGESAAWYAKLSPADQKSLKERVELQFAPHNQHQFAPTDEVSLQVELKNVPQLIVKIYEINTRNHYRNTPEPIGTGLDLDGLVANVERKFEFTQASQLRHAESITLPELSGRGVWVVDLLGGGQRSRAVIQKGNLVALERLGDAGHVFQIVDESGELLKSAHIEMNGEMYQPDASGKIILPYAESNLTRNLMLVSDGFASMQTILHRSETYELQAGFIVDREALVAGTQTKVAIRARLSCNGRPISIKLLEEPTLTLVATDLDGVATTQVVNALDLDDGDDLIHAFLVPQRLANVSLQLAGKILNQNRDEKQVVSASDAVALNGIQRTDQIADFFLVPSQKGYVLSVLGRNGEPIARLPVTVAVKVDRFATPVSVNLATNEQGVINLGELVNVSSVTVSAQGMQVATFATKRFHRSWPSVLQIGLGSTIVLPLGKDAAEVSSFNLVDVRRDVPHSNHADKLKVTAGAIEIRGLGAGDYWLHDYEAGQRIRIVVADSKVSESLVPGKHRVLQASGALVAIRRATVVDGKLEIEVSGNDAATRVHVLANSFLPEQSHGQRVELPHAPLMYQARGNKLSLFVDSLRLDEEYSYILQRQGIAKYPGNMLAQPTLLVHPWEVSVTQNSDRDAAAGDPMPKKAPGTAFAPAPAGTMEQFGAVMPVDWKSFDFLARPRTLAANFEVVDGKVSIPLERLAGYSNLTVLAIHATGADSREVVLPAVELMVRDLRLKSAFPRESHLAQTQRVDVLGPNEKKSLGDPRTRRVQAYSSIADVHRLYGTLLANAEWEKFAFVGDWHKLTEAERRSKYNEMACHELNFFLYHKDRKFFDSVVKPLLAQKLYKQLVDLWLLDEPLDEYTELWRVQRLNTLERILLAQRIKSRAVGTMRWLGDVTSANPLDPQSRAQRFEVALRGKALEGSGGAQGQVSAYFSDQSSILSNFAESDFAILEEKVAEGEGGKQQWRSLSSGARGGMGGAANQPGGLPADRVEMLGRRIRFSTLDQTREWAETQYYRVQLHEQLSSLIPPGPFWKEYFEQLDSNKFLPTSLDLPTSRINEALCALAVIDLPLDGIAPEVTIENEQLVLDAKNASVVYVESIEKVGEGDANESVLIGQDVYLAQPGSTEGANRPVQTPLLRGIPYRMHVVVSNPTNNKRLVQVLTQVPAGALPLSSGKVTRSTPVELQPYSTAQVQYVFYFPNEGEFEQYGSQVSSDGKHVVSTGSKSHRVLAKPESVDESTWSYIADWGTSEQVIEFLKKANLEQIGLSRIAFRMRDKAFFNQLTTWLTEIGKFEPSLWAYAVLHNEPKQISQLLQNRADFTGQLGAAFRSDLLKFDPREQFSYQHLDYKPLVVARIHQLGPKALILNDKLSTQYEKLLDVIAHQRSIDNAQQLSLCYYLLLQNRIDESLKWFDKVDAGKLATRLQYDYFDAYLGFYRGTYDKAAQVAGKYSEYPVLMWKDLFAQVGDQVRQRQALLEGKDVASVTSLEGNSNRQQRMLTDGREATQTEAAAETPTLDLANQDGMLSIEYRNLKEFTVNYYFMDIELLFSRNPFVARSGDKVPVIEPNLSEQFALQNAVGGRRLELPAQLANRNLLVEVTSSGISRSTVVTANSLAVTVVEPFGRVQVLSAKGRSPLERAYVKVYARLKDGTVKFYKDGYTDLRGQFDYATLSTLTLDSVDRFAILVLHDEQGAVVREASPPTR